MSLDIAIMCSLGATVLYVLVVALLTGFICMMRKTDLNVSELSDEEFLLVINAAQFIIALIVIGIYFVNLEA